MPVFSELEFRRRDRRQAVAIFFLEGRTRESDAGANFARALGGVY